MHRGPAPASLCLPPRPVRRRLLLGLGAALLAPPAARAQLVSAPLRVAVISDLNESYGATRYAPQVAQAIERIVALAPPLVLCVGDMVAGQRLHPPLTRAAIESMWAAFHANVSTPLARAGIALAVTPGNHDAASGARFALEREIYREQWLARRPALDFVAGEGYPFDYAFRHAGALFVSFDATFVGPVAAAQRAWLQDVLATHGPAARQRIVFAHVPMWPVAQGREHDYLGDHALEAVLRGAGVDLVLSGHHHAFYPGVKDGLRYVSMPCLGAAPRRLLATAAAGPRAIGLIETDASGALQVEALAAPQFVTPIQRPSLPAQVRSPQATLVRDDLAARLQR